MTPANPVLAMLGNVAIARPGLILAVSLLVLLVPASSRATTRRRITYDFLRQLPQERPSRQGAEFMQRHFDIGERDR